MAYGLSQQHAVIDKSDEEASEPMLQAQANHDDSVESVGEELDLQMQIQKVNYMSAQNFANEKNFRRPV